MKLEDMSNEELLDEWNSYNDVIRECSKSQSSSDLNKRSEIEEEMRLRCGRFEVIGDEHIFDRYELAFDSKFDTDSENDFFSKRQNMGNNHATRSGLGVLREGFFV